MPPRKIIRNSARCLDCGDEIESKYRHDFVVCSCMLTTDTQGIAVDGGKDYLKRSFGSESRWEDTSITEEL